MLRKLIPIAIIFFTALLDTAIVPMFSRADLIVPLTAAVVFSTGLLYGVLYGSLYGMIGGLFIDVSAGSPPMLTIMFICFGVLPSVLLDERADALISDFRFHLRRGITAFALYMISEIVMLVYTYFLTASFSATAILYLLLRSLFIAVFSVLFTPLLQRVYFGRTRSAVKSAGGKREVTHF